MSERCWPVAPPAEVLFYRPDERDRALLPRDPFTALVAPRPIGWISTVSADGVPNIAPYSFFAAVSDDPPMLAFSSDGMKDSAANAIATGEFVWNLATWDLREQMNATSARVGPRVDEFALAGLETVAARVVRVPRVAQSPVALECRVAQTLRLTDAGGRALDRWLVVGEVVGVHLDEAFVLPDGRVDTAALRPVARAGYRDEYAVVDRLFHLSRPD